MNIIPHPTLSKGEGFKYYFFVVDVKLYNSLFVPISYHPSFIK